MKPHNQVPEQSPGVVREALRLGFPDASSPFIKFSAEVSQFLDEREEANRRLNTTLGDNRSHYHAALFPRCPVVA